MAKDHCSNGRQPRHRREYSSYDPRGLSVKGNTKYKAISATVLIVMELLYNLEKELAAKALRK